MKFLGFCALFKYYGTDTNLESLLMCKIEVGSNLLIFYFASLFLGTVVSRVSFLIYWYRSITSCWEVDSIGTLPWSSYSPSVSFSFAHGPLNSSSDAFPNYCLYLFLSFFSCFLLLDVDWISYLLLKSTNALLKSFWLICVASILPVKWFCLVDWPSNRATLSHFCFN